MPVAAPALSSTRSASNALDWMSPYRNVNLPVTTTPAPIGQAPFQEGAVEAREDGRSRFVADTYLERSHAPESEPFVIDYPGERMHAFGRGEGGDRNHAAAVVVVARVMEEDVGHRVYAEPRQTFRVGTSDPADESDRLAQFAQEHRTRIARRRPAQKRAERSGSAPSAARDGRTKEHRRRQCALPPAAPGARIPVRRHGTLGSKDEQRPRATRRT